MPEPMPQPQYVVAFDAVRHVGERTERVHGRTTIAADSPDAAKREIDARFEEMGCQKWITEVVERAD